jgi:hypothetical protein
MNGNAFDAFTRQAADAISRRTSLLAIGGATLTAVAAPSIARAKKKKNKCRKQKGKCEEAVRELCENQNCQKTEEQCLSILLPCCEFFSNCNAKQGVTCLVDPFCFPPPPPP